ncbi:hypothetical protein FD754_024250, partial [Muntiacus muntjak]
MAEVLSLQLLTLWLVCPADITPAGAVILKEPLLLLQLRARSPASSPRPWLGAQPAAVVTPGVNVTLRCQAPQPAWRFALFRSAELTAVIHRDVPAELAEFFLEEVTPAQGGRYQCCYWRRGWGPDVWSHPSDALELLVTGAGSGPRVWGRRCGVWPPGLGAEVRGLAPGSAGGGVGSGPRVWGRRCGVWPPGLGAEVRVLAPGSAGGGAGPDPGPAGGGPAAHPRRGPPA